MFGRPNDCGVSYRGIVIREGLPLCSKLFEPTRWPAEIRLPDILNCDGSPTKTGSDWLLRKNLKLFSLLGLEFGNARSFELCPLT